MKLSLPLAIAALAWQVDARYLIDFRVVDPARPTQTQDPGLQGVDIFDLFSVPPSMTTPPPSQAALELRLRQDSSGASSTANTWLNSTICGWYSGLSSQPYQCGTSLTCATDTANVVDCATSGLSRFYTMCLDFEAVQSSKCTTAGPKTTCCGDSDYPACGTYLWSGTPTRSMYGCFATPTLIAMIDQPQFVIDASISSAFVASASSAAAAASRSSESIASASSAAAASASLSSASAAAASRASELGGSSVTITTTTTDGSLTTFTAVAGATGTASGISFISNVLYTTTGSDGASTTYTAIGADISGLNGSNGGNGGNGSNGGSGGSGGTNVGAIAGGAIGGILGLLMMLLLLWYLKKKTGFKFKLKLCGGNKKVNKTDNREYKDKRQYNNRDNREYDNREYDNREYDNHKTFGEGSGKGGLSLFGGKSKSKKEEQTNTTNHYYGDEVRNDSRSYDKRKYNDHRGFEDKRKYNTDSDSYSVTPSQTQHFHLETGARASHGSRPSFDSHDEKMLGIGAFGGRGSSNREQRKQGRSSRTKNYVPDSRSPSPAQWSPTHEAAIGAGTSRRDKRRQERRQARSDRTPSPKRQAEPERAYSEDEDEERASGRPGKWQLPSQIIANAQQDGSSHPQNVHVHVHIHENELDRESRRGRSRQSRELSRASSRRAAHYDDDEYEMDEEKQQELERGRQGSRTHRYHPGSGRRNVPVASLSPSRPRSMAHPPDDFLGKAL